MSRLCFHIGEFGGGIAVSCPDCNGIACYKCMKIHVEGHRNEYLRDIAQEIAKVPAAVDKLTQLMEQVKEHLEFIPGGVQASEAGQHFNTLVNKQA